MGGKPDTNAGAWGLFAAFFQKNSLQTIYL
jgi:hypothetical protein